MRVVLRVSLSRTPPLQAIKGILESAREAGATIHVEGKEVMVIGGEVGEAGGEEGMEDRILLELYDMLLAEGLMDEEEIQEPQRLSMVGLPILDGGLSPPDGGEPAPGGLSPPEFSAIDVCELMAAHACKLAGLRIRSNRAWSGDSAWIGLCAREVILPDARLTNVDGHVTLFYLGKTELPLLDDIVRDLEDQLERVSAVRGGDRWEFRSVLNAEYAQEGYAWCDIVAHSTLHGTLHHLVHLATSGRMSRQSRLWLKPAFHFSVARSQWTALERD